ncbi:hypothetical protein F4809DRAFT_622281 [Biscogniauxia mediterranea]|nr:hypothetical protein F4809DRAFT_622281 [Biscogniauxia mediterranea]
MFSKSRNISPNLVGGQQELVSGYVNGQKCLAIPDTGSDIMVLSRRYARRQGLKIYNNRNHRSKVQFVDGSQT